VTEISEADITRIADFLKAFGPTKWEANTCAAHIVLDDDNFDDENLKWCIEACQSVINGTAVNDYLSDDTAEMATKDLYVLLAL